MNSAHNEEQLRPAATASSNKQNVQQERELEPEEEDPVIQYLMNKKQKEQFDQCLWFSRGMHHIRFPGARLHTAVQDPDTDEYIAVLGHGCKWKWLLHRVRCVLSRPAPGVTTLFSCGSRREAGVNGEVPHVHLCITTREGKGPKQFDTMSLAEALTWCDENQLGAYLECCTLGDLPFYKARGFKVVQKVEGVDEDCALLNSLWRAPRRRGWRGRRDAF